MSWRRLAFSSRYLLATNTILSLSLEGLSDYTQQKIEKNEYQDWRRTGRMTIMGALFGPVEHFWYRFLDRKFPGVSRTIVCKKVIVDEVVFGLSSIAVFFYGMSLLEGRSKEESWNHVKNNLWPTYKFINFYYLPPAYRVLYLNVVNYLWCIYLSYMQHKRPVTKE